MKNIIIILALLLACSSALAQTGSQKSAAALNVEVNALLPTNGQNEINAYSLRQIELDIIASTLGVGGLPLVVGTQTITNGTNGYVLYDNNGILGLIPSAGTGTVTSLSIVSANGISGSVANPTTTPAITLSLGAITPASVNGNTVPNASDTVALLAATQTLTNKSIAGSEINSGTIVGTYLAAINLAASGNGGITGILPVANGGTGVNTLGSGVVAALGQPVTGSGGIVLSTSPSLTTPSLGAASATSINGVTIGSSGGTLSIASGKTLSDTSGVGANLLLGATSGGFAAYSGAACTNQALIALSATGSPTCASIVNAYLTAGTFSNITGTGTLTAGAAAAGFTLQASNVTWTGTVPTANLPEATSSAFGTVKPDNVTTTVTAGVITANPSPFNARAPPYNAVGNGSTDDTTALQSCITAAETAGNTCYVPAGQYKITTALSITTHVSIKGDGYQGIGNACIGNVGGCIQLTSTNVGRATTIEPSSTINAFTVTADDSVSFSDFQIVYLTSPTLGSGIAGISLGPTTGSSSNNGFAPTLDRVMIAQADVGLYVSDIYAWNVGNSIFYNNLTHGIQVTGVNFLPDGDWDVHDSMFIGGYANGTPNYQDHLFIQTTCGRVVNNKFNSLGSTWATYGIHIQPIASATIEPCHFIGNSLEGLNDGIFLDGSGTPTSGRMNQWLFNDNQFYGGSTTSTASFTGSISGTTLTVSGVTGTIFPGMAITGSGVTPGTFIVSGSGTSWTVNNSQSVGSEAMTASVPSACIYSTPDGANTAWATGGTINGNFCTVQLGGGTTIGFDLNGVGILGITGNVFGPNGSGTGTACFFGAQTSEIAHSGNYADTADGVSLGACGNWVTYQPTPTASSGTFTTASVAASYALNEKTLSFTVALTVTSVGSASGNILLTLPTGMTANGYFILSSANLNTETSYLGQILNGGSQVIIGTTTIANDSYSISGTIQIN